MTNEIITALLNSDELDFENYTLVGVIRSQPSPNTEKDAILIQDKHGEYWVIIGICDIASKSLVPTIE
jgi:hypothetical protein